VPKEPKKASEFRRYRQALTGLYLGTVAVGFALLTASVLKELLLGDRQNELPEAAVSPEDPDPEELLRCQQAVLSLLDDLGTKTCELLSIPPRGGAVGELSSAWEEFSDGWLETWQAVGARCGFRQLADTNMGIAYDRMAWVHGDLRTTRLKYQSLLVRFENEQAAELAHMRRALDLSGDALRERVGGTR
jgi:hypothetical protein